jgi:hypothetical protein
MVAPVLTIVTPACRVQSSEITARVHPRGVAPDLEEPIGPNFIGAVATLQASRDGAAFRTLTTAGLGAVIPRKDRNLHGEQTRQEHPAHGPVSRRKISAAFRARS